MAKLALALLCAAFALVAARQLHQSMPMTLPEQLQALNDRVVAFVSKKTPTKASTMAVLAKHYDDYEKYGKHGHYEYVEDKYDEYEKYYDVPKYYYGGEKKVAIKLWEKFRSKRRTQALNGDTFQFTSELTCQNPNVKPHEHDKDGLITFPVASDRMNLVTVGLCEWTVTLVKEQKITEHATLKGSTNVVCRFTEEVERNCPHAEDVLCADMAVSGQGLVYNFAAENMEPEQDEHEKYEDAKIKADAGVKEGEEESLDVFLTIINGVTNAKKHLKWDNGALQYFLGKPSEADKARDGSKPNKKGDPTGELTFVFRG